MKISDGALDILCLGLALGLKVLCMMILALCNREGKVMDEVLRKRHQAKLKKDSKRRMKVMR